MQTASQAASTACLTLSKQGHRPQRSKRKVLGSCLFGCVGADRLASLPGKPRPAGHVTTVAPMVMLLAQLLLASLLSLRCSAAPSRCAAHAAQLLQASASCTGRRACRCRLLRRLSSDTCYLLTAIKISAAFPPRPPWHADARRKAARLNAILQ